MVARWRGLRVHHRVVMVHPMSIGELAHLVLDDLQLDRFPGDWRPEHGAPARRTFQSYLIVALAIRASNNVTAHYLLAVVQALFCYLPTDFCHRSSPHDRRRFYPRWRLLGRGDQAPEGLLAS